MIMNLPEEYKQKQVSLVDGGWNEEENLEIVSKIKKWEVQKLYLWNNQKVEVLRDISHIHFENLNNLEIQQNNIESVQGVNSIDMPMIQRICLSFNNIQSIKCLRKAYWPKFLSLNYSKGFLSKNATIFTIIKSSLKVIFPHRKTPSL